jgi:hypothetical protein
LRWTFRILAAEHFNDERSGIAQQNVIEPYIRLW